MTVILCLLALCAVFAAWFAVKVYRIVQSLDAWLDGAP